MVYLLFRVELAMLSDKFHPPDSPPVLYQLQGSLTPGSAALAPNGLLRLQPADGAPSARCARVGSSTGTENCAFMQELKVERASFVFRAHGQIRRKTLRVHIAHF